MPAYGASDPQTLEGGRPVTVWEAETVDLDDPSGEPSSMAVGLQRSETFANCLSVEIEFDSDPGAIQIDLQTADTDEDKYYVTKASLEETNLNDDFIGRIEATNVVAKFARLKAVAIGTPAGITAKFF